MTRRSPVLETLARLYEAGTQGQMGAAARDFGVRFTDLLAEAKCERGEAYANALADLAEAERTGALELVKHPRSGDIQRVKMALASECALFARIGRAPPSSEREAWAALLEEAAGWPVPETHAETWKSFCRERAGQMRRGKAWQPFRRKQRHRARIQLEVVARLLAWKHPALLRTVSARIVGGTQTADPSKFLGRCRSTLETLLDLATDGKVCSFEELKITDNPSTVIFNGPIRVRMNGNDMDYTSLGGESSLSEDDLSRAEIECNAPRCVSVENKTTFHELCRLRCGDVFVFTSYPNRATVEFLRRLPATMPRFHFGDTDPWGFDVLRSLRAAIAPVPIAPLHMEFRTAPNDSALNGRDRKKLAQILADASLSDVRSELERMRDAGTKGEQETILVSGAFPYR